MILFGKGWLQSTVSLIVVVTFSIDQFCCGSTANASTGRASLVYRDLCMASPRTVNAIANRAFVHHFEADSSKSSNSLVFSWIYVERLNKLCTDAGYTNTLPQQVTIRKLWPNTLDRLRMIVSARVIASNRFTDSDKQSGFKAWIQFQWPIIPFICDTCRANMKLFIHRSNQTSDAQEQDESFQLTYGLMTNLYPAFLDMNKFAAVLEQDKSDFINDTVTLKRMPKSEPPTGAAKSREKRGNKAESNQKPKEKEAKKSIQQVYAEQMAEWNVHELNLSAFARIDQYLLLGINSRANSNKSPEPNDLKLSNGLAKQFELEYGLCFDFDTNSDHFLPLDNCIAVPFQDRIRGKQKVIAGGDCVCWIKSSFKLLILLQLLLICTLLLVSAFFKQYFASKANLYKALKKTKMSESMPPPTSNSGSDPKQSTDASQPKSKSLSKKKVRSKELTRSSTSGGETSSKMFYQLIVQFCCQPSPQQLVRLTVRLYTNAVRPVAEHTFKIDQNTCTRPYLMYPDLLQVNHFISVPRPLPKVHRAVVSYTAEIIPATTSRIRSTLRQPSESVSSLIEPRSSGGVSGVASGTTAGNTTADRAASSEQSSALSQTSAANMLDSTAPTFYLFGLMLTVAQDYRYECVFPYGHFLPVNVSIRLSEAAVWRAFIGRLPASGVPIRELLPISPPPVRLVSPIEKYFVRIYFACRFARIVLEPQDPDGLPWYVIGGLELLLALTQFLVADALYMRCMKPLFCLRHVFVRFDAEQVEMRSMLLLSLLLPFLEILRACTELRMNPWRIALPADSPHKYEQYLFTLDLEWLVRFAFCLVIMAVSTSLLHSCVVRKPNTVGNELQGPQHALEERLVDRT